MAKPSFRGGMLQQWNAIPVFILCFTDSCCKLKPRNTNSSTNPSSMSFFWCSSFCFSFSFVALDFLGFSAFNGSTWTSNSVSNLVVLRVFTGWCGCEFEVWNLMVWALVHGMGEDECERILEKNQSESRLSKIIISIRVKAYLNKGGI